MDYIALLRKDAGSDYGVDFPDFPGCVTAGADLDDAREMAVEALGLHIAGMLEDGEILPGPSSLKTVMADPHNRDAVAFLISVPEAREKAVRVNITLPESVLHRVDARAAELGTNRSAYLRDVAVKDMESA